MPGYDLHLFKIICRYPGHRRLLILWLSSGLRSIQRIGAASSKITRGTCMILKKEIQVLVRWTHMRTDHLLRGLLWDLQQRRVGWLGGDQGNQEGTQLCCQRRPTPPSWRVFHNKHRVDLIGRLSFPAGVVQSQKWIHALCWGTQIESIDGTNGGRWKGDRPNSPANETFL